MLKFGLAEIGLCGSYIGPQYDYRIVRGQNIRGGRVIFSHSVLFSWLLLALQEKVGRSLHSWVKYSRFNHKNHEYFNCPPSKNYPLYQTPLSHPYSYFIVYHTELVDSSHASQSGRSCGCGEYLTKVWCKG